MINSKKSTETEKQKGEAGEKIEKFNDFHEAFSPPKINKVLEQMFKMLKNSESYGHAEQ